MLKVIGVAAAVVLVAVILVVGIAMTRPASFRLERSAEMQASPERVFAQVDNFHNWAEWSPWQHLDPAMKTSFSGPDSGKGAVYEWEGNSKAGKGRMEIVDEVPGQQVIIKLDFLKPFVAHNMTTFTMKPIAGKTNVTWAMEGPNGFMTKVMSVFVSMDKMVGGDFERGLANLKAVVER